MLCEGAMSEVQNNPRAIEVYLGEAPEHRSTEQRTVTSKQLKIAKRSNKIFFKRSPCSARTLI